MNIGYIAIGVLIFLALFTLNGFAFGVADTKATGGKVDWKQARKDAFEGFLRGCLFVGIGLLAGFGLIIFLAGLSGYPLPWL